ncbi:MAG TPA: hypothetical protein VGL89_14695 [Candidatus Koribacter sp.]|jgi:hypothetical protein
MSELAHPLTHTPAEVVRLAPVTQAPNGILFASLGQLNVPSLELERVVSAVPGPIAKALSRKAYYFVPLTIGQGDDTLVADRYDVTLSDQATCHRNFKVGDSECVFISTRLMEDRFSIAFEFFINVGHGFVDQAGVSGEFAELAWKQVQDKVRGETSLDAYELRKIATSSSTEAEKAKNDYLAAVFADSIAIYLLSLYIDVDYYDLRERDYPLLAPNALAERLRKVNAIFPPNPSYEFAVYYKRRQ